MDPMNGTTPQTYTMQAAAKAAGVSVNTIRKHLRRGTLKAEPARTAHGDGWAIEAGALAAFVLEHYERGLNGTAVEPDEPATVSRPQTNTRGATAELRARLDATLVELGRYKALAASADDRVTDAQAANARVEEMLKERIAELQHERDAAQAKAEAWASRRWWQRRPT